MIESVYNFWASFLVDVSIWTHVSAQEVHFRYNFCPKWTSNVLQKSTLGALWVQFGHKVDFPKSTLGTLWVQFGHKVYFTKSTLGTFWVHFGPKVYFVGTLWVQFGSKMDQKCTLQGTVWVHFGYTFEKHL